VISDVGFAGALDDRLKEKERMTMACNHSLSSRALSAPFLLPMIFYPEEKKGED